MASLQSLYEAKASLISYWPLVSIGNGLLLQDYESGFDLTNVQGLTPRAGAFSGESATDFDGSTSFAKIFSVGALSNALGGSGVISVTARVRADALSGTQVVFRVPFQVGSTSPGVDMALVGAELRIGGRSSTSDSFQTKTSTGTSLSVDTWYQLTGIINIGADSITAYRDGTSIASGAVTFANTTYAAQTSMDTPSLLGAGYSAAALITPNQTFFNGALCHVAIFAGALDGTDATNFAAADAGLTLNTISGNAKIGSTPAHSVRVHNTAGRLLSIATPDGAGDYSCVADAGAHVVVCHHDDPAGAVTRQPEAAQVATGSQVVNFSGPSAGGGNSGGILTLRHSAL